MRRLVTAIVSIMLFSVSAQAQMISTEAVLAAHGTADRQKLNAFMERDDVTRALTDMGVDADAAKMQVAALTDEEIAHVNQKIDSLPAGGDIVSVMVFVFLVLLITDILGVTKVFPFTKSIR